MIIFPAIDIRQGRCVRLVKGDFSKATVYGDDPSAMARRWESAGAAFLHIVDLDGALVGRPVNVAAIAAIAAAVQIPFEVGGGIRSEQAVEKLLDLGASRVIIGSAAVRSPEMTARLCCRYGGRIAIGIDARDGVAAVDGWEAAGGIAAVDLAVQMAAVGAARIIYTDIARDGTLTGVNCQATAALARAAGIPVIASGGVRGLEDIKAVRALEADGVEGLITGKALYDGTLDLGDALRCAEGES